MIKKIDELFEPFKEVRNTFDDVRKFVTDFGNRVEDEQKKLTDGILEKSADIYQALDFKNREFLKSLSENQNELFGKISSQETIPVSINIPKDGKSMNRLVKALTGKNITDEEPVEKESKVSSEILFDNVPVAEKKESRRRKKGFWGWYSKIDKRFGR